jgi:two-component system, OmpR family, phosphate regulon sensor histidine kinase PhoR
LTSFPRPAASPPGAARDRLRDVRRLLLVNALIFAILVAAAALAFYGYSYTSEVSSREREIIRDTLRELADEKVLEIEGQLLDADEKLFESVRLDPLPNLTDIVKNARGAVASIFVLDADLGVLPGGHYSNRPRNAGLAFSDFFRERVVPMLPLRASPPGVRGHLHRVWDGRPYLFSYIRRISSGRTFYIVVEADLSHLVGSVFPQFFAARSQLLYQIVDERGDLVYGSPFRDASAGVVVEQSFTETVNQWRVRVAQKDAASSAERSRRRIIDFFLIGLAVTVILAGLGFLAVAIRRERRANDLKSEFISNVSHELKTPLSIISMFGEMLALGRVKGQAQATEYAEIIWRESVRLARLIDNVLDFARIERGGGGYEFADCDIADVVARALEVSGRRVSTANMAMDVDIAAELPMVRLDANAYTLAVLNLIDNAIKYAAEGKRIEVKLAQIGEVVELSVRDFGPGIEPEEQEHVFERFYRAKAVRLKPIRGSGIGLALVQHIVRAHHGEVVVESTPGAGATFRLRVPVSKTAAA